MPPSPAALVSVRRTDIPRMADCRQTSSAAAVLQAALDHGPVARSSVARLAGLSPAAVSRLSARLTKDGPAAGGARGGRGPRGLACRTCRSTWTPACWSPAACTSRPSTPRWPCSTCAAGSSRGSASRTRAPARAGADSDRATGPGRSSASRRAAGPRSGSAWPPAAGSTRPPGSSWSTPVLGWRDVPVGEIITAATGLPVRVDNHSRALARAERAFGDSRARTSIVHLLVGNVVDAAFATGDTVPPRTAVRGRRCGAPAAGRAGGAVPVRAARLPSGRGVEPGPGPAGGRGGHHRGPRFQVLLAAARGGDERAVRLFRDRARLIGVAAALLADVLNPELLVVAEEGTAHLPGCLDPAAGRGPGPLGQGREPGPHGGGGVELRRRPAAGGRRGRHPGRGLRQPAAPPDRDPVDQPRVNLRSCNVDTRSRRSG